MSETVLITGGSGALGKAMVQLFTQAGNTVFFTYNKNEKPAAEIARKTGATAIQADLTSQEQVAQMVSQIEARVPQVDVLVNNAGATQVMPFALIEEEDWDYIMNACLKSMFLTTKAIARGMIAAKRGVIINIGSIAGKRLLEVPVHYAAAKAAVSGFTISLAREFARYNIRVNTVVPGMLTQGVSNMVPEKKKQEYLKYCAAGRPGEMNEVASAVAFLASDAASYINAQEIVVDGGL
ncbi:MAG: SDR family oxidoreductase [Desulfobacterales bacterium]|nr:SDR family oxidoreductase [Desulfobacterales bacterium]